MSGERSANTLGTSRGYPPAVFSATHTEATGSTNTVVSAVADKRIAVIALSVSGGNSTGGLVTFLNDNGSDLWRGFVSTSSPIAHTAPSGGFLFQANTSTALNVDNNSGANAHINVAYVLEDP